MKSILLSSSNQTMSLLGGIPKMEAQHLLEKGAVEAG